MAWIELHQTLPRHPKLIRLANRLRIHPAQAAGHLTFLWLWTLDYAPTGDLSAFGPAEISAAACFPGDAELFAKALSDCGWLDEGQQVHDWMEYAGRLVQTRQKDKDRKRIARSGDSPKSVQRTSSGHPSDGGRTADVPNPTQQNHVSPNGDTAREARRFTPPKREELDLRASKMGLPPHEVDKFVAHYGANGWKVGKNPMKSWEHALDGWNARWRENEAIRKQPSLGFSKPPAPHRNDRIAGQSPEEMGKDIAEDVAKQQANKEAF